MSRLFDFIRSTPMYAALLEQVPEGDRPAAIEALKRQIAPYEALTESLPAGAFDSFMSSLAQGSSSTDQVTGRRLPRRF